MTFSIDGCNNIGLMWIALLHVLMGQWSRVPHRAVLPQTLERNHDQHEPNDAAVSTTGRRVGAAGCCQLQNRPGLLEDSHVPETATAGQLDVVPVRDQLR